MRKSILVLMAVSLLLATGCQKNNNSDTEVVSDSDTGISEPVTETEKEKRHLTKDDFNTLNMNINISDDEPPVEIHNLDLSELDFGARFSPCKAEDVRHEFISDHSDNPEWQKEIEERYEKLAANPCDGFVERVVVTKDKLYMIVNFDDYCYMGHDWTLFSYDVNTGELKEIKEFNSLDEGVRFDRYFQCYGERLLLNAYRCEQSIDDNGFIFTECVENIIYEIDPETGDFKEIYRGQDSLCGTSADGEVIVVRTEQIPGTTGEDGFPKYEQIYSSFDPDTGETGEMLRTGQYVMNCRDGSIVTFNSDNSVMITGSDYTLELEQRGMMNYDVNENKVYNINVDSSIGNSNEYSLNIYDTEKMEHTVSNINGFGHNCQLVGDALISGGGSGAGNCQFPAYYIIPEIATAFRFGQFNNAMINVSSEGAAIWDEYENSSEYYENNGKVSRDNRGMLYWFTY